MVEACSSISRIVHASTSKDTEREARFVSREAKKSESSKELYSWFYHPILLPPFRIRINVSSNETQIIKTTRSHTKSVSTVWTSRVKTSPKFNQIWLGSTQTVAHEGVVDKPRAIQSSRTRAQCPPWERRFRAALRFVLLTLILSQTRAFYSSRWRLCASQQAQRQQQTWRRIPASAIGTTTPCDTGSNTRWMRCPITIRSGTAG